MQFSSSQAVIVRSVALARYCRPVAPGSLGEVEVAAAWAEVRVGANKSESTKTAYMILDEGGSGCELYWSRLVVFEEVLDEK